MLHSTKEPLINAVHQL